MSEQITTREWWDWLLETGLVKNGELVRRVIIDIPLNDLVTVYVERIGYGDVDPRAPSKLTPTMIAGMEVRVVE